MKDIIFFDTEIEPGTGKILDIGAVADDGSTLHTADPGAFAGFIQDCPFLCGHNVIAHDLKYTASIIKAASPFCAVLDTLPLSPLLFPKQPYHRLLKDDKLQTEELNNPLNDAMKARDLFHDEMAAFAGLSEAMRHIYYRLLKDAPEFSGAFRYVKGGMPSLDQPLDGDPASAILREYRGSICGHAPLPDLVRTYPVELAFALSLIRTGDSHSIIPPWVAHAYPQVDNVLHFLRNTPCREGCAYCRGRLDVRGRLKDIFGFDAFRTYDGEPLQEQAASSAVRGESLLAVFPTGGGKSVTFQLPALMAGESVRGLTVVISPLQSLMKDQVDHLEEKGIADAVTINGLLDPIERKAAVERVASGMASILYIAPESLRSKTVETLLLSRNVVRFVIDEAHCFSAWGQDFRVDYLYIGSFIRKIGELKQAGRPIPVSCFTATAKQKVISDILAYFQDTLGLTLKLYTTRAVRHNLHYAVLYKENDDEKYLAARNLLESRNCPSIIYVSRVKRAVEVAGRLKGDGFAALPFHGRMESRDKVRNQNAFLSGEAQVIVATSAFGMGVDKKDVGLVIHYDISDSLENYVQEAGRAGRDASIEAECFVLFNEQDLDKHFLLLNQTKLSLSEIQQVWRAIKELSKNRPSVSCSALEIARQAGWGDNVTNLETRVTSAVAALENAGYLRRGRNVPRVYADSILVKDMVEASRRIETSGLFTDQQKELARRSVQFMISRRTNSKASRGEAESRVDYIADFLGTPKEAVIRVVCLMREEGILADHTDLTAFIQGNDTENRSALILKRFCELEKFLMEALPGDGASSYKEVNDAALRAGVKKANVRNIRTILFFWAISGIIRKQLTAGGERFRIEKLISAGEQEKRFGRRASLAGFIIEYLYRKRDASGTVLFSVLELQKAYCGQPSLFEGQYVAKLEDVQSALLYLTRIRALSIDGGFLVTYNAMQLERMILDNRIQYKKEDYRQLDEFYRQKIQQIHIVGEYANLMVRDYGEALAYVGDYFQLEYNAFLAKYFKGNRRGEINRNITSEKYDKLFGSLTPVQRGIIDDSSSRVIVVAAGPGSGKTMVLAHKLASLLLMEDVRHDQLLMLTFSRAAATEFKKRLMGLIGNAAHYVEIKTFHSYCFDLLGRIGSLEETEGVVEAAVKAIENGEVEPGRITKTVMVLDEAQDMNAGEFALVRALMKKNGDLRVIAVGDDDQNIYQFRGSDSGYLRSLKEAGGASYCEMTANYRSRQEVVEFANAFVSGIQNRMKRTVCRAVDSRKGTVTVTRYRAGSYLEIPAARQMEEDACTGSICVMTATNQEAMLMAGHLRREGMPAKLVQSMEGFDLYHLAEIRCFLGAMGDAGRVEPLIPDERWKDAREHMEREYGRSTCLPLCLSIIDTFAGINRRKYVGDFLEYLHESRLEDFLERGAGDTRGGSGDMQAAGGAEILVSTMHRSKGRQFDTVYLLLKRYALASDEAKRVVYVALTRARSVLRIFTDSDYFHRLAVPGTQYGTDDREYPPPDEILLELGHRDVALGYFKYRQPLLSSLRGGDRLVLEGDYLCLPGPSGRRVAKLSAARCEKLGEWKRRGYGVSRAEVRFTLYWKGKEEQEEAMILLPNLYLAKSPGCAGDPVPDDGAKALEVVSGEERADSRHALPVTAQHRTWDK